MYNIDKKIDKQNMLIFLNGDIMENIHAGHRDRLREKAIRYGIDSLEDHEVLEVMLSFVVPYKDMNPPSHELLNKFGSIHTILTMPKEELVCINGIGDKTAKYIYMLGQFARYFHMFDVKNKKVVLNNPSLAYHYCSKLVSRLEHEELYVICLTPESVVKCSEKFSRGSSNETALDTKNIIAFAIRNNCSNIMICHNHPQGSCEPSEEDIDVTKKLYISLALSGIQLVDHVIVGNHGKCYSFARSTVFHECLELLNRLAVKTKLDSSRNQVLKIKPAKYDIDM